MPTNVEIKLKVDDLDALRRRAIDAGATEAGLLIQTDTFFNCTTGRLKLRVIENGHAELIAYARSDDASARSSDYALARTDDPAELLAVLSRSLGARGVVEKRRTLLLWRNVRIHLDRVTHLGHFVELESVVGGDVNADQAAAHLSELTGLLGLGDAQIVPVAYMDLLAAAAG